MLGIPVNTGIAVKKEKTGKYPIMKIKQTYDQCCLLKDDETLLGCGINK